MARKPKSSFRTQGNILTPKGLLILWLSLVILATIFLVLNQVKHKQSIGSKAITISGVPTQCTIIISMDAIPNMARSFSPNTSFCVAIPRSVYKIAYVTAVRSYIQMTKTTMIGEPIDTNLVSYNNIKGTFSYGPPYERKLVEFFHYYYVNTQFSRIETRVTSATIGGRPASNAEKGTIESEANKIAVYLWGAYSHLVKPTSIFNDANYVYVTFTVLGYSLTLIPTTSCSQCGYFDSSSLACSKACPFGQNCSALSIACGSNKKCWKRQCSPPRRVVTPRIPILR
jgi:hypothetical protein